jgi:hypothetical protein
MPIFLAILCALFLSSVADAQTVDCQAGFANNPDDRIIGTVHISADDSGSGWGFQSSGGESVVPGGVSPQVAGEYDFPFAITAQQYNDTLSVIGPPGGICYIYNVFVSAQGQEVAFTQAEKDKAAYIRDNMRRGAKWVDFVAIPGCTFVPGGVVMSLFCAASGAVISRELSDYSDEQQRIVDDPCTTPADETQYPDPSWYDQANYGEGDCGDDWLCQEIAYFGERAHYSWEQALLNSNACRVDDAKDAKRMAKYWAGWLAWGFNYWADDWRDNGVDSTITDVLYAVGDTFQYDSDD